MEDENDDRPSERGNSKKRSCEQSGSQRAIMILSGGFFIPSVASLFFRPVSPGCASSAVYILLRSTTFSRKMVSLALLGVPTACESAMFCTTMLDREITKYFYAIHYICMVFAIIEFIVTARRFSICIGIVVNKCKRDPIATFSA